MARVCVGCGLTTDSLGNLIIAASGAAGDNTKFPVTTACTTAKGTHIYCDSVTGELFGEPEKFFRMRRFGKSLSGPEDMYLGDLTNGDTDVDTAFGAPIVLNFTNPSPCRPMNILIESGISHAQINSDPPGGSFFVKIGTTLGITGDVVVAVAATGHQIWRYSNPGFTTTESVVFDSMGARAYSNTVVIPAGGTITMTLQCMVNLFLIDATANVNNLTIDLVYTAWND